MGVRSGSRGGRRAKAGRRAGPRGSRGSGRGNLGGRPNVAVRWDKVGRAARAGATEKEIVTALEISDQTLADPAVRAELRRQVEVGNAKYNLGLRAKIKRRAFTGQGGGVNTLHAAARNHLGWDRPAVAPEFGNFPLELANALESLVQVVTKYQKGREVKE